MVSVMVLFGIFGALGVLMIVTLLRRNGARTESAEGLLLEQQAARQAQQDRVSFGAAAVHNSMPTASDTYSRRETRP
ncbi:MULTISPECIES: hypothetical protein [unclassified Streptomyces]|uniref:hypothetical protein n=1 Tax=unclassified Streptomyces TaxID=2593676 RepID=UPI0006FC686A|nr:MULTISPECIES: hypothetical protein [unclassified Streptomyces]KQX50706.1 hypothetical protein ASD33_11625 [Streptomyces sp. Root1304]KRA84871.1 hypothetical protein ASE09_11630 [Streptomyces sp. Root66D1]